MTIMMGSIVAGRQAGRTGVGTAAESSYLPKKWAINSQLWLEEGSRDYYLSLLDYLLLMDLEKGRVVTINCFHWRPHQTPMDRTMLIKGHADGLG